MKSCYRKTVPRNRKTCANPHTFLRRSGISPGTVPAERPERRHPARRTEKGGPRKENREIEERKRKLPRLREGNIPRSATGKPEGPTSPHQPRHGPLLAPHEVPAFPPLPPKLRPQSQLVPPIFPPQLPYQPREVQTVKVQKPAPENSSCSQSRSPAPCLSRFQHPPRPAPRPGSRPRLPPVPPPTVRELQEVSESRGLGQHAAEAMSPQFLASTKARRSEEVPAATV